MKFLKFFYKYIFFNLNQFDLRTRKTFLRRCKVPNVSEQDLYIGAKLLIYGRQIEVVDYGDTITQRKLGAKRQKTFLVVKPLAFQCTGKIIALLNENRFSVQQLRMVRLNEGFARIVYDDVDISGNPIEPYVIEI